MRLKDKSAAITGAPSGLNKGIVIGFVREGARADTRLPGRAQPGPAQCR